MPLDPAQRHQIEQDAITAAWQAERLAACDDAIALLREIADLERDDDGDVIIGTDANGFLLLVVVGKEGCNARHQVVGTVRVGTKDHVAVVVGFQIGDLTQQGDGTVAGGKAVGLPRGGDRILFDLVALGGIKRHARPR